jgi:TolB-like protein
VAGAWYVGRQSAPAVGASAGSDPQHAAASIAVLPFVNMSDDESNEYFSDGISEELLNLLAKIPELQVAARTSSFSFKGQNLEITEIADRLNVEHVLEGSVRKSGEKVRITAQLIRAGDGFHL